MAKLKLTKAQADVIRKMREGAVLGYIGYKNSFLQYPNGMYERVNSRTHKLLLSRGYVSQGELTPLGQSVELPQ